MADLYNSSSYSSDRSSDENKSSATSELEEFIMVEKQKAQFSAQVFYFSWLLYVRLSD